MLLYFVVMPRVYGFSTLGSVWALAALSVPFILATSFLGQALGLVFRHRETAVLLVLASSLPQFFLVGVSWPVEALPGLLRQARELLPSVKAIDGMVRINQMGASLVEVRPDWLRLWGLTLLYFVAATAIAYLRDGQRAERCAGCLDAALLRAPCRCWLLVSSRPSGTGGGRARTMWRLLARDGADHRDPHRPEISGRVARFLVEPRQAVQRGQPVAVLSNPELWAAVGAARARRGQGSIGP